MAEHEKPPRAIRHAEKRRTSTCRFADRVAQVSVDSYHSIIPKFYREQQKQTCVATIVAHDTSLPNESNRNLIVLAMGVGTKFLSRPILEQEHDEGCRYGERVRDCHAEVLARRAFRRQLSLEILRDLQRHQKEGEATENVASRSSGGFTILQRCRSSCGSPYYQLRPEVSLHFYSSSAPCGNAVLKKFATLRKEKFRPDLTADEWPLEKHLPIAGHAVPSGEFALLVKMDISQQSNIHFQFKEESNDAGGAANHCQDSRWKLARLSKKQMQWPLHAKTDWCPPGTTTVWSGQGRIHTCSDKLCRWNLLGLQGSLLSSLFAAKIENKDQHKASANDDDDDSPLNMHTSAETNGWPILSTLTIGRKLNAVTCRRAVCCRFGPCDSKLGDKNSSGKKRQRNAAGVCWQVNHPAILGTSVYLDEHGVVETSTTSGQDVRFHSALCWAWWLDHESGDKADAFCSLDCIDGTSGWAVQEAQSGSNNCWGSNRTFEQSDAGDEKVCSRVSTAALLDLYQEIDFYRKGLNEQTNSVLITGSLSTLAEIRALKRRVSSTYEKDKETILTKHPVFCQWNRREYELD